MRTEPLEPSLDVLAFLIFLNSGTSHIFSAFVFIYLNCLGFVSWLGLSARAQAWLL